MDELKSIPREAIPRALARAERYRLLNEPREAESICRDILAVDPDNQEALVSLVLAITDLFRDRETTMRDAQPFVARLPSEHDREYYAGVVEERWGKSLLHSGESKRWALGYLRTAMQHYEKAQHLAGQAADDDQRWDAILRWNTCVRVIERHGLAAFADADDAVTEVGDEDVPMR